MATPSEEKTLLIKSGVTVFIFTDGCLVDSGRSSFSYVKKIEFTEETKNQKPRNQYSLKSSKHNR